MSGIFPPAILDFMGAWHFLVSAGHKISRFRGGCGVTWKGGEVPILFLWARGFFLTRRTLCKCKKFHRLRAHGKRPMKSAEILKLLSLLVYDFGYSKPVVCQTYGLHASRLSRK